MLAVILFAAARYGFQNGDEAVWLSESHRLALGDRWISDNVNYTQFYAIFQYIPFRLLTAAAGGTEGIILAMRWFYLALKLCFSVFLLFSLRRYRYWGLLSAVIFLSFHPLGFQSLTYYAVAVTAVLAVGA